MILASDEEADLNIRRRQEPVRRQSRSAVTRQTVRGRARLEEERIEC